MGTYGRGSVCVVSSVALETTGDVSLNKGLNYRIKSGSSHRILIFWLGLLASVLPRMLAALA